MHSTLRHLLFFLGLVITCLITAPAFAQNSSGNITINPSGIVYTTQPGDTLIAIARELTTSRSNWVALGKINNIGKDSNIPIGTGILIPANLLADEPASATIIARTGNVVATNINGTSITLTVGGKLNEGSKISTAANSFLTLQLSDASRISLPSNSSVELARLRKTLYTGSPRTEIRLLQGKVVSRVSPLNTNKGQFEVSTPRSVAGVRGTYFRVGLQDKKVMTEVLEGSVAVGLPTSTNVRILGLAKGNIITNNIVGPAIDLLAAPELKSVPSTDDGTAHFSLQTMVGAHAYHLQIADNPQLLPLLAEQYGSADGIQIDNIAPGNYYLRLSAIDKHGLEGLPRIMAVTIKEGIIAPKQASPSVMQSERHELVLRWPGENKQRYKVQVARDLEFSWLLYTSEVEGNEVHFPRPDFGTYFARVQSINPDGSTTPFSFAQALLVTDQWIINEGHPQRPKKTLRNVMR
tara:strand:+ start:13500 stop:14897 length:1398 start_codon:yes stop_codon:yes gene_type:complete